MPYWQERTEMDTDSMLEILKHNTGKAGLISAFEEI